MSYGTKIDKTLELNANTDFVNACPFCIILSGQVFVPFLAFCAIVLSQEGNYL